MLRAASRFLLCDHGLTLQSAYTGGHGITADFDRQNLQGTVGERQVDAAAALAVRLAQRDCNLERFAAVFCRAARVRTGFDGLDKVGNDGKAGALDAGGQWKGRARRQALIAQAARNPTIVLRFRAIWLGSGRAPPCR